MTRYKYRPPARGANSPAYPHLDMENLPPKPGPSRIERQIKEGAKAAYRSYRDLPDGATGTADRYLGKCPAGDGAINWGDAYIVRQGKLWHSGCDPQVSMFVTCEPCGAAFLPESRYPCCDTCWPKREAALWSMKGLQDFFSSLPKSKWR